MPAIRSHSSGDHAPFPPFVVSLRMSESTLLPLTTPTPYLEQFMLPVATTA